MCHTFFTPPANARTAPRLYLPEAPTETDSSHRENRKHCFCSALPARRRGTPACAPLLIKRPDDALKSSSPCSGAPAPPPERSAAFPLLRHPLSRAAVFPLRPFIRICQPRDAVDPVVRWCDARAPSRPPAAWLWPPRGTPCPPPLPFRRPMECSPPLLGPLPARPSLDASAAPCLFFLVVAFVQRCMPGTKSTPTLRPHPWHPAWDASVDICLRLLAHAQCFGSSR